MTFPRYMHYTALATIIRVSKSRVQTCAINFYCSDIPFFNPHGKKSNTKFPFPFFFFFPCLSQIYFASRFTCARLFSKPTCAIKIREMKASQNRSNKGPAQIHSRWSHGERKLRAENGKDSVLIWVGRPGLQKRTTPPGLRGS